MNDVNGDDGAATGGAVIRPAVPGDTGALLGLIRDLATYEREPGAVLTTEQDLNNALFGPDPKVFALVAELEGTVAGMAIYFLSFSTWTGTHSLYLEDLFVRPEHRSAGLGRRLLSALAARAVGHGYRRLEWAVLDWNEPAIGFYRSIGAVAMDEWTTYRVSGPALVELARLGRQGPSAPPRTPEP